VGIAYKNPETLTRGKVGNAHQPFLQSQFVGWALLTKIPKHSPEVKSAMPTNPEFLLTNPFCNLRKISYF
jgi:hypothetical protein